MFVAPILFIALGVLIKHAKMYFLIAGYNTMPQEEKAKYDIEGIATLFRNVMAGMGLLMLIAVLIDNSLAENGIAKALYWGPLALGIPYLLIMSNSKRYKTKS